MLSFFFFKEFIIGFKLSIQLLQILRIDGFVFLFFKNYVLHTALLLGGTDANKCGQYCFHSSGKACAGHLNPVCPWLLHLQSLANSEWLFQMETGEGWGVHLGPSDEFRNWQCRRGFLSFPHSLDEGRPGKKLPHSRQKSWRGQSVSTFWGAVI